MALVVIFHCDYTLKHDQRSGSGIGPKDRGSDQKIGDRDRRSGSGIGLQNPKRSGIGWSKKKFRNRTMKIFLREMGVWVLIYVKFWGEQCSLVKVCQKDFIFKTSGARIWSKFGSPIRRSSRGDRSGTAHHGWLGSKKFRNRTMKIF